MITSDELRRRADLYAEPFKSTIIEAADEIDRLLRRNEELTISEEVMASQQRVSVAHSKMICDLNKQLSEERDAAKARARELERMLGSDPVSGAIFD